MSFWKTIKEVSPGAIEKEAERPFKLALVGESAAVGRMREILLTDRATGTERGAAAEFLTEMPHPPDAESAKSYAFVLYASGPGEQIGARGENSAPVVGLPVDVAAGIIAQRPDLAVTLARRFPLFRAPAAQRLINDACRNNAGFALLSALPGVLPITAIILPASSMADVFILTKNQIMLVMRLAAAFGQKPGYTKQIKEILGTVATAMGWRTVARQVVGLVPAGVGAALKATIAYSGTLAVGRAALAYYEHGQKLTPQEIRKVYNEHLTEAKQEVEAMRAGK